MPLERALASRMAPVHGMLRPSNSFLLRQPASAEAGGLMNDTGTSSSQQNPRTKPSWGKRLSLVAIGLILAWRGKLIVAEVDPRPMPPSRFTDIGGDFTLEAVRGPVSLHDFRGKVVVLYFGYMHCPDVCPAALANVAAAFRLLRGLGEIEKVDGIFVTLDPDRNSVEKTDAFARYFHNRIVGLSGDHQQIAAAARAFKVAYEKHQLAAGLTSTRADYSIDHSDYVYIVRPDGQIGEVLGQSSTPKDIVEAIKPWLRWTNNS